MIDSVSVVIATSTQDRWLDLVEATSSAHAQDPAPFEVIAVVDHNPELLKRRSLREGRAKATLWHTVGGGEATSIERTYFARTLASGFVAYLGRGLRGSGWDFVKAANLVVGLSAVSLGFLQGQAMLRLRPMATAAPMPWPSGSESREEPAISEGIVSGKGLG